MLEIATGRMGREKVIEESKKTKKQRSIFFKVSQRETGSREGRRKEGERGGRERESVCLCVCVFMNEVSHCRCVIGPTSL